MAMSCDLSDESVTKAPPDRFHVGNESDGGSHWSATTSAKCPLCVLTKKDFYCRDCIRAGDFQHSTDCFSAERFADKQLKYMHFKSVHRALEARCNQLLQKKRIAEDLKYNIKRKKENIVILRQMLDEKRAALTKSVAYQDMLIRGNKEARKKLPQYEKNVNNLCEFVEKRLDNNDASTKNVTKLRHELKYRIRHNLQMLIKYIFPIWQTTVSSKTGGGAAAAGATEMPPPIEFPTSPDTINALADATHLTYVRGHWAMQQSRDDEDEFQHIIVAPSLPNDGNYSAYNEWVATAKDGVPNSGSGGADLPPSQNSAFRISAALTYTVQLVDLLSFYLDVRLPYKVMYSDFCKKELSEQSFNRKVARLNANILYLAYTQGVQLNKLKPLQTLTNIMLMMDPQICDLGRIGACDIVNNFKGPKDSQLVHDLNSGSDSESEDENSFPNEWEAIPHLSMLDLNSAPTHQQMMSQQQASSIAGGLVNNAMASVTSIWRVWSKR